MTLENSDILELIDRYTYLVSKYSELALDLVPKLEKLGKYRQELQLLTVEFSRRNIPIQEYERGTDALKGIMEKELSKRNTKEDGEQTTNT